MKFLHQKSPNLWYDVVKIKEMKTRYPILVKTWFLSLLILEETCLLLLSYKFCVCVFMKIKKGKQVVKMRGKEKGTTRPTQKSSGDRPRPAKSDKLLFVSHLNTKVNPKLKTKSTLSLSETKRSLIHILVLKLYLNHIWLVSLLVKLSTKSYN